LINKKNAFVISLLNAFIILICGLKFGRSIRNLEPLSEEVSIIEQRLIF